MPILTSALTVLVLLSTDAEIVVSPRPNDCSTALQIDLSALRQEGPSAICITPDQPTTFVFDDALPPAALVLEPPTSSLRVAQGDNFVTVYAKRSFLPGERVKLTVRFSPLAAPTSESFWLMGHVARGVRQVEVFRHPRPVDALERQARESRIEAHACQEEKARILKENPIPGGLVNFAWLEREDRVEVSNNFLQQPHRVDALTTLNSKAYAHTTQLLISLEFANESRESWSTAGALLSSVTGEQRELPVWQETTIPESGRGFVFVGPMGHPEQLSCPCVLKLWDESGKRTVTYENVTFRQLAPRP